MMGKQDFKKLIVRQRAKDLAVFVYRFSSDGALGNDFSLRDQIRRSAVSVASNLAEGNERDTDKESVRFFYIAKGSLGELRTQLQIAFETGQVHRQIYERAETESQALAKMIGRLIQARFHTSRLVPRAPRPALSKNGVP